MNMRWVWLFLAVYWLGVSTGFGLIGQVVSVVGMGYVGFNLGRWVREWPRDA